MHEIDVHAPEIDGSRITFRFDVTPPSDLYRRTTFTLDFPPSIDLTRLPSRLPGWLPLVVLHLHWALLAPCRVRLRYPLDEDTCRLFERLAQQGAETLAATRGVAPPSSAVRIVAEPCAEQPTDVAIRSDRCAVAFSGGKDSLLHVGLLTELTDDVVLVAVTSPMPPLEDHVTARRRRVLEDVAKRRPITLIEVKSDVRTLWNNAFSHSYGVSVSEVTDTLLYTAALWTAAAALDCGHTFLASENEVSETATRDGIVVQLPHFMYAVPTLVALDALARGIGLRYGSLTPPLHSAQVQHLLWTRYPDLRDLQYSCWRTRGADAACSSCAQCLRIALGALAAGGDPAEMGVDLARVLRRQAAWRATAADAPLAPDALPNDRVRRRLHAQVVRHLQDLDPAVVRARLPRSVSPLARWRARWGYRALRRRHLGVDVGLAPGYRREWLRFVDPLLRERVGTIFADSFPEEERSSYAAGLERTETLSRALLPREHPLPPAPGAR